MFENAANEALLRIFVFLLYLKIELSISIGTPWYLCMQFMLIKLCKFQPVYSGSLHAVFWFGAL